MPVEPHGVVTSVEKGQLRLRQRPRPALRLPGAQLTTYTDAVGSHLLHADAEASGVCYGTHISCENRKRRCTIRQLWKDLWGGGGGGCWTPAPPLCLCVDGGHVAQAAVEAAHREEDALLRAGRELAPGPRLQLLAQAEAWDGGREGGAFKAVAPEDRGGRTDGRTDDPHLRCRRCYPTRGSRSADETCRSENPPGWGCPRRPSGTTPRNGSSSGRCPGSLEGRERSRA